MSTGSQIVRKGERGLVYRQSDCKEGREGTCLQAVRLSGRERVDLSTGSQNVRKGESGLVYRQSDCKEERERGLVYRQSDCKEGREWTCLQAVRL